MLWLYIIIALIAGALIPTIVFFKKNQQKQKQLTELEIALKEKITEINFIKASHEESFEMYKKQLEEIQQKLNEEIEKSKELIGLKFKLEEEKKSLLEKLENQKTEIEEIRKNFLLEFENLAGKILKQNTEELSDTNQKKIENILNPLKEKISEFEKKVSESYEKTLKDQTDLKAELKKLYELNNAISKEAKDLTNALKGDVKIQGNWGEMVLERILERSGLTEGEEYIKQFSTQGNEGQRLRPDIIIKLPGNKHIIVDSKVSLVAYEQYVNADDPEEKQKYAKLHVDSLKAHIKNLNEKNYSNIGNLNSPDFVLMFLPIEASLGMAVRQDIDLFNFAWERRVVLVSPSTLLATLKTIESIWKREKQTQNAMEIAAEGGKLYDKFVGFIEDLRKLGAQIETVKKTYEDAERKLCSGTGSILKKVENLRKLGAKNTKNLPSHLFTDDNQNDEQG